MRPQKDDGTECQSWSNRAKRKLRPAMTSRKPIAIRIMFRIIYSPIQGLCRSCDLSHDDAVEIIVGDYQRDDLVSPPDDGPLRHAQERANSLARHVVDI